MAAPALNDTWYATAVAAATMSAFARVTIDTAGKLALAGDTDNAAGYLTERGATSGSPATYRTKNAPSQVGIAAEAMEVGDLVYSAASGKVADTAGTGHIIGRATSATTAADQLISFVPVD
jgi:hypothetical protein